MSEGFLCKLFVEQTLHEHDKVKVYVQKHYVLFKNEAAGEHQQGNKGINLKWAKWSVKMHSRIFQRETLSSKRIQKPKMMVSLLLIW